MGYTQSMSGRFIALVAALVASVGMAQPNVSNVSSANVSSAPNPCSYDTEISRFQASCKDGQRDDVCTDKCRASICTWLIRAMKNTNPQSSCKQSMPKDFESRFPRTFDSEEAKKNGAREAHLYYTQSCQVELKCDSSM